MNSVYFFEYKYTYIFNYISIFTTEYMKYWNGNKYLDTFLNINAQIEKCLSNVYHQNCDLIPLGDLKSNAVTVSKKINFKS